MKNPFKFEDKSSWINVGFYSGVAIVLVIIISTVVAQIVTQ